MNFSPPDLIALHQIRSFLSALNHTHQYVPPHLRRPTWTPHLLLLDRIIHNPRSKTKTERK